MQKNKVDGAYFDWELNILPKNIFWDVIFRVFMTRLEVKNDTFHAQSVYFCLEVTTTVVKDNCQKEQKSF